MNVDKSEVIPIGGANNMEELVVGLRCGVGCGMWWKRDLEKDYLCGRDNISLRAGSLP